MPITVGRLLSLLGDEGRMFSPRCAQAELERMLGHMAPHKVLIAFAGADEYVDASVNKNELVAGSWLLWAKADPAKKAALLPVQTTRSTAARTSCLRSCATSSSADGAPAFARRRKEEKVRFVCVTCWLFPNAHAPQCRRTMRLTRSRRPGMPMQARRQHPRALRSSSRRRLPERGLRQV